MSAQKYINIKDKYLFGNIKSDALFLCSLNVIYNYSAIVLKEKLGEKKRNEGCNELNYIS